MSANVFIMQLSNSRMNLTINLLLIILFMFNFRKYKERDTKKFLYFNIIEKRIFLKLKYKIFFYFDCVWLILTPEEMFCYYVFQF